MGNPMNEIQKLKAKVETITQRQGLDLVRFVIVPKSGTHPDMLQCVFALQPDTLKSNEERERDKLDNDFEAIMAGMTAEVDEDNNVTLDSETEAEDPATAKEREAKQKRIEDMEQEMREALGDE